MKRKLFKFTGVGLALVLMLSMLPFAGLVGAAGTYGGYQFGPGGTVTWDTGTVDAGKYAVKLDEDASALTYMEFIPAPGTTMSDLDAGVIAEWSFRYNMATGTSGGPNIELRFTMPGYDEGTGDGHVDVNVQAGAYGASNPSGVLLLSQWANENTIINNTAFYYGNDPVDGTAFQYDNGDQNAAGVDWIDDRPVISEMLAEIDAEAVMDGASAADWELTRVRIELADSTNRICYIDDVTIDGVTYEMEPMVLDAAYYSIGETVDVSVFNGNANTDPMAIEEITVEAESDTDTVGDISVTLTETGSNTGVFAGSVTLLGAAPANRANDEIVVSAEDTVIVTLTAANWGNGVDTIVLTASVDDTAPVITIVSPAVSDNISNATPLIRANYADAGSTIDSTTAVMTLDGTVVVTPTYKGTDYISYQIPDDPDDLADGSHTVTVDVSDLAGNAATQASWSFTVDTTEPVIADAMATPPVIAPDEETEVAFSANVTDATSGVSSVTIDLSDSEIGGSATEAMLDADGDGIYTVSANITAVEGSYLLDITATDFAGNEEVLAEAIPFVVSPDIVVPVITIPAIAYEYGSSVLPGGTVTISANVTDDVLMGDVVATSTTAITGEVTLIAAGDTYTWTGAINSVGWGDYPVTITATDAKGNVTTDETLILMVRSGATGKVISLEAGWNLVSLPLIPDSASIATVISNSTLASGDVSSVGIVRGYDPASGLFPSYMPGSGGDLTEMNDGAGYWIFMNTADDLTVTGKQWPSPPAVPPSYDVVVGWNMIGLKSLGDEDDSVYLANIAGTYPVIWSYNAVSGAYENVEGVTDGMVVGHGFWIWITTAGTIVPPG